MTVHDPDCTCDIYGCRMRRKGINLSYDASPTRRARRPWRTGVNCSENGGLAGEARAGGNFFMPYLVEDAHRPGHLRKVHTKEGRDRRSEIRDIRDRQRKAPATP